MKRTAKECNVTTDRFTTGKTTDGLVYDCLKNRSRQVFTGCTFVDQRLNICFCKYTATGSNRVDCFIIFRIFVQTAGICLDQGSHLVDKGTSTAGADTVHSLLNIAAFKINDLGILTTKLDSYVCLWSCVLQSGRYSDNLLYERYTEVFCQCQTTGTGDHRTELDLSEFFICFMKQIGERFADICEVALIIGKN